MKWLSDSRASNLIFGVIFVLIVAALAVVGYMLNGWSFGDSLFMVSIFTVGYDERRVEHISKRAQVVFSPPGVCAKCDPWLGFASG
jgi:hypothetical protein